MDLHTDLSGAQYVPSVRAWGSTYIYETVVCTRGQKIQFINLMNEIIIDGLVDTCTNIFVKIEVSM